jgi:hypothetical protein
LPTATGLDLEATMTTRPHLGEQLRFAPLPKVRASASLLASLRNPTRYVPPSVPTAALVTTDNGEIVDIDPPHLHDIAEQPRVARYPVRHNALLVGLHTCPYRPIAGLERAKLWTTAVGIERSTKSKGSRVGCLHPSGLQVFNALLFRFANTISGRCDPSYTALQEATGLCRDSISKSLKRLARCGLITITRRWLRVRDPASGQMVARQITNAYAFAEPSKRFFAVPSPERSCRPIPRRTADDRQGILGIVGRILGASLLGRQKLKQPAKTISSFGQQRPLDATDTESCGTNGSSG